MVWFLEFQRQWYQRWSLNIMATSWRTQLYKVRTYCTTTGVPTKYKTTSETPDVIPINNMFEWNCCRCLQPCAVHMVQSPISLSPGATDRKFFIPNKAFKTQIQSPNLPSILPGPFEDVQLFQEGDYERMCLSRFRSPRSIGGPSAPCSHGFVLISLPSASLASLRARLPNLAKSCVW